MRKFLLKLNEALKGFRTVLALLSPLLFGYVENIISTTPTFTSRDLKVAAMVLLPALLKAMWTEVRPKVLKLWLQWLSGGDK